MHMLADLSAGSDCSPRIDHSVCSNVGSDIDISWHHHAARLEKGSITYCPRWHDPDSLFFEVPFQRNFIVEREGPDFHFLHLCKAEVEQNRLFDPGMGVPLAVLLAAHTQSTGIELSNDTFHSLLIFSDGKSCSVLVDRLNGPLELASINCVVIAGLSLDTRACNLGSYDNGRLASSNT